MPSTFLILGASGGLGSAIARRLSGPDATLILHGRQEERLRSLAAEIGAGTQVMTADLTSPGEVGQLFRQIEKLCVRLDGVVFSIATPFPHRLTHRTPWQVFEQQIGDQLKALHLVASESFKLMSDGVGTSRFVVISTEAILGMPPIKMAPYAAAKAAMTTYAEVIAQEWLSRNIRVHIVAPGMVKTDLLADRPDEYLETVAAGMPEKRLTSADDVAQFVNFLFTDAADPLYGKRLQLSRAIRR
jgi:NAD(P)-dependent dehydrogenase (short-subunit alcohol dehydrogenase family)